jgi:hypothetical protein
MLDKWNIVIVKMRHEQQMLSMSTCQWLDVHNKHVGDVELLIVVFWHRNMDIWTY